MPSYGLNDAFGTIVSPHKVKMNGNRFNEGRENENGNDDEVSIECSNGSKSHQDADDNSEAYNLSISSQGMKILKDNNHDNLEVNE